MHFETWNDYQSFSNSVRSKRRYIFDKQTDQFLKVVAHTSEKRKKFIKKGSQLWRAQKGHNLTSYRTNTNDEISVECPFPAERMKPQKFRAREGRANPKGIPFLYLSDDKETAMSEVRPWLGAVISVALFRINRKISVIDCTSDTPKIFLENPLPEEREQIVWGYINEAFSIPVENDNDRSEYVPTQILAELFRDSGFDGIAYKSLFGKGLNIALFNLDDAIAEKCFLFKAKSLKFEFEDNVSPYNSVTY